MKCIRYGFIHDKLPTLPTYIIVARHLSSQNTSTTKSTMIFQQRGMIAVARWHTSQLQRTYTEIHSTCTNSTIY